MSVPPFQNIDDTGAQVEAILRMIVERRYNVVDALREANTLSRERFYSVFKKIHGVSPKKYLAQRGLTGYRPGQDAVRRYHAIVERLKRGEGISAACCAEDMDLSGFTRMAMGLEGISVRDLRARLGVEPRKKNGELKAKPGRRGAAVTLTEGRALNTDKTSPMPPPEDLRRRFGRDEPAFAFTCSSCGADFRVRPERCPKCLAYSIHVARSSGTQTILKSAEPDFLAMGLPPLCRGGH